MLQSSLWKDRTVLITGHTGFKGSWLSLWLSKMGAKVIGYSLPAITTPNLFSILNLEEDINSIYGDIRDRDKLENTIQKYRPEVIFHLAAQPIVTTSYIEPLDTLEINIIGTANILNAVRNTNHVKVVINITSDKCYENKEQIWGYRESEPMGGYDPYSCSKGCSELITNSFRNSYFNQKEIMLASARAGNVIGGGDWAENRIVPDVIRGLNNKNQIEIRNPHAIRPWQHVLEPLSGYISLAERLWEKDKSFAEAWNFGPDEKSIISVKEIVSKAVENWNDTLNESINYQGDDTPRVHETQILKLDSSKAKYKLGWSPKLDIDQTIKWTMEWYKGYYNGDQMKNFSLVQIKKYENSR